MPLVNPTSASGYPKGTVPTVVQVTSSTGGGNSAVFGGAPTQNNLLVAICFNPTSSTAGSGWTQQFLQGSGTDFGVVLTKTAGASESATQTPLSGVSTTGSMVIYELHSSTHTTPTYAASAANAETLSQLSNSPVTLPNILNGIGICTLCSVTTGPASSFNVGTQDVNVTTTARPILSGHADLSSQPICGIFATYTGVGNSKTISVLITA